MYLGVSHEVTTILGVLMFPSVCSRVISPVCLSPHFRLLQICESRQQNGDLEGIDALLGKYIIVPHLF